MRMIIGRSFGAQMEMPHHEAFIAAVPAPSGYVRDALAARPIAISRYRSRDFALPCLSSMLMPGAHYAQGWHLRRPYRAFGVSGISRSRGQCAVAAAREAPVSDAGDAGARARAMANQCKGGKRKRRSPRRASTDARRSCGASEWRTRCHASRRNIGASIGEISRPSSAIASADVMPGHLFALDVENIERRRAARPMARREDIRYA